MDNNVSEQNIEKKILAPVKQNNMWGLIDKNGVIKVPIKYDHIGNFSEGLVGVSDPSGYYHNTAFGSILKQGFIDFDGNTVIPFNYQWVHSFHSGLARVVGLDSGLFGFINKDNETVIPMEYNTATDFSGGLATVRKCKRKWGDRIKIIDQKYLTLSGSELFSTEDTFSIGPFKEGLAVIGKGKGIKIGKMHWSIDYGYIDKSYSELITAKYQAAEPFVNGYAMVKNAKKHYGVIDKNGNLIIDHQYDKLFSFQDGLAYFKNEGVFGQEGFINIDGEIVIKTKHKSYHLDPWSFFKEGYVPVYKNDKMGFMNKTGNIIIPLKYTRVHHFQEGFARVVYNNQYSFIDYYGNNLNSQTYTWAEDFQEGFAPVYKNDKWGFIDKSGIEVIPCLFDEVRSFQNVNQEVSVYHDCLDIDVRGV